MSGPTCFGVMSTPSSGTHSRSEHLTLLCASSWLLINILVQDLFSPTTVICSEFVAFLDQA